MCVYQRYIRNLYTGKYFFAKCGKCPACLQEKASKRTSRIRNHYRSGQTALFITLTYANIFVPYVRRSDLMRFDFNVPVYRDASVRKLRFGKEYNFVKTIKRNTQVIANIDYDNIINFPTADNKVPEVMRLPHIKHGSKDKIGIIVYSDLQRFYKRLRVILQRKYGIFDSFSYFGCSEYGPSTCRPHFHVLLFVPSSQTQQFMSAVSEAWPFDSKSRKEQSIQIARNAASYVSSYVNSHSRLSRFYSSPSIKEKHSYSQNFGFGNRFFKFENVISSAEKSDFSYQKTILKNGVPTIVDFTIPKYVITKYFPIFQGYYSMPTAEVSQLLQCPTFYRCLGYLGKYFHSQRVDGFNFCTDGSNFDIAKQAHVLSVKLRNWLTAMSERGFNSYDASILHQSVHRQYKSYLYKKEFVDIENLSDFEQHYDNVSIIMRWPSIAPTLQHLDLKYNSPNEYPLNIDLTLKYESDFLHYDKTRKLNNKVMSDVMCMNV